MTFVISKFSGQPSDRSVDSITRPASVRRAYAPQWVCLYDEGLQSLIGNKMFLNLYYLRPGSAEVYSLA